MAYIPDNIWDKYKDIINNVHSDFNQDSLTLFKKVKAFDRFKEGEATYNEITLKCLVQYNIFRTWPMTDETDAGALDQESIAIYLNNKYLKDNGYLTVEGNLDFDPGNDYFIFQGQKYRSSGETPVSQAKNEPLFTLLILKRNPTQTSKDKY